MEVLKKLRISMLNAKLNLHISMLMFYINRAMYNNFINQLFLFIKKDLYHDSNS